MRKIVPLSVAFTAFLLCATYSHAQDRVTLRNGSVFDAKVVSIEGDVIKYKDSKDAVQVSTIFTMDVYSIQFENGMTQVFEEKAPQTSQSSLPKASQTGRKPTIRTTSTDDTHTSGLLSRMHVALHFGDVTTVLVQDEIGSRLREIPLDITGGVAIGGAFMDDLSSTSLRIPVGLNYSIGSLESWHLDIYGGIAFNYLLRMSYGSTEMDLSGYDRDSWNGTLRFAAGYKKFYAFGQYDFSFQSGVGGSWYIGIGSYISD